MKTKQQMALALGLGLMALAALILAQLGPGRLGTPGVKLVAEPTYTTNGVLVRTESVWLPTELPGYDCRRVDVTPLEINWLPKDTLFGRKRYVGSDGFAADTSVVLMGTDRTSIHKPQYRLISQGLRIEKTETAVIPIERPYPYDLRVMKLTTSRQGTDAEGRRITYRGLYVYWFVADKLLTPFHEERMWWMAKDMIRSGVLQRWAYVTYFTEFRPELENVAFARLKELIAAAVPEFQLAAGPRSAPGSTAALSGSENDRKGN